ncbi:osmoprotectant NAGGN system M42 family peptidase [Blastococcus sp. Marseille-P5729]|uniref:osmoprotectant NAGGN system M42 family peptidase n=1 Tax=Blastococcus sp. Marseille-P5729 TaxID=2086582 RepID=UPI0018FE653C|nr:osmoprotectant NAGGN system M42 family peptidase [Blastococcus sp. Marseille-P5729]
MHNDTTPQPTPSPLPLDRDWLVDVLLQLLQTPSPSGRTDTVMKMIGEIIDGFGVPFTITRRGALIANLPGESATVDRAVVVHADTIGCMVRELKPNGRLAVIPVGTFSPRFAAGARVRIFIDGSQRHLTGTILPLKASGHAFGDGVDDQPTDWDHVEVRVDQRVHDADGLRELGIQIGDMVALVASPELSDSGFVVSRHLDGKAGVAIALALAKSITDHQVVLPHRTSLMVTITEEVGHGASNGLPPDVAEMISIDNAVCAPGQHSIEHGVTIPMADMHGPFDFHLTQAVCARRGARHHVRAGHLPVLPLRHRRRDRGGCGNPGRPGRGRGRRQPWLGAHRGRVAGGGLRSGVAGGHHAADLRGLGRPADRLRGGLPGRGPAGRVGAVGTPQPRRVHRPGQRRAGFDVAAAESRLTLLWPPAVVADLVILSARVGRAGGWCQRRRRFEVAGSR